MKIRDLPRISFSISLSTTLVSRTLPTVAVMAMLTLAGCAPGDGPNGGTTPSSSVSNNPGVASVGNVIDGGGNIVAQVGKTVSDLDTTIGTAPVSVIGDTTAQKDLGTMVTSADDTIQALGGGISNGLGKIGPTPDLVGTTVQDSGDVTCSAGVTAGSVGQVVLDPGTTGNPLASLNPVTSSVGNGVSVLGQVIQSTGGLVTIGTSGGPMQQITQQTDSVVVPLSS